MIFVQTWNASFKIKTSDHQSIFYPNALNNDRWQPFWILRSAKSRPPFLEGGRRSFFFSFSQYNFNNSKFKILTVSPHRAPVYFYYMSNGNSSEHVTAFKYLRVLNCFIWFKLERPHTIKDHIHDVVSTYNRGNGMIKLVVGYHCPNNVTLNVYKHLTRSITEYCTSVWSSQNIPMQLNTAWKYSTISLLAAVTRTGVLAWTYYRHVLDVELQILFYFTKGLTLCLPGRGAWQDPDILV